MDCQEKKVGECVTKMLLQVHTQVEFGLEDQITRYEDQFVASCMRIISQQQALIERRSPLELQTLASAYQQLYTATYLAPLKLRKVLPVEEKRIIACLSYLKMLVLNSEKDGCHGLFPHSSLDLGAFLDNITVNNAYEQMNVNGFRSRFTVQIWSNATIY